jgi:hypothetical protein
MSHTKAAVVQDVVRSGAGTFNAAGAAGAPEGWPEFVDSWNSMPIDDYLPDGGRYRRRQYGRVEATRGGDGWDLRALRHAPFCQPVDVVPLYAGRARMFPPIPGAVIESPALQELLKFDLDLVSQVEGQRQQYLLGLHMVRVTASSSQQISPAPEGRHRDGHEFVIMHLIAREQCVGGVSRVFAGSGAVLETTMEQFLDTIVVDDRRVEHEVGPITATTNLGWRDTLLVDFMSPPVSP